MKKIVLILGIALFTKSLPLKAQNTTKQKSITPTTQIQNKSKFGNTNTINDMVINLKRDTCLDKKFSIVIYVFQDLAMAITAATHSLVIDSAIKKLNKVFKPICVSFEHCSTVVIPNYVFSDWNKTSTDTIVTANYYTENTINLYLPIDVFGTPPDHSKFYAHPYPANNTVTPRNIIVVAIGQILDENLAPFRGGDLLHAFGDFFGLPHTYDEINPQIPASPPPPNNLIKSLEYNDRSNCYLHGDGFCDTEADCYPIGITVGPAPFCYYASSQKDGKGAFYIHPSDNFMAFSSCRCRFTQEQYNYMAHFILTKRMYLH